MNRVTQSGAELLWNERKLTTKMRTTLASARVLCLDFLSHVVVYFKRTELLSGVQEKSGI